MSGGVQGPSTDDVGRAEIHEQQPTPKPAHRRLPRLSSRHYKCLAVAIALSAAGMVAAGDLAFAAFSLAYVLFLARVAFPLPATPPRPVFPPGNRAFRLYVSFSAVIGLYLPVLYISEGVFRGDKDRVRAAAPHLFLLCSQVVMEGVTFTGLFSLPIMAFVPIFYNSYRMFAIAEWLRSEFGRELGVDGWMVGKVVFARGLAVVNTAFWSFNLLGFLMPVFMPRCFKGYYGQHKEKA